MNIRKIHILVEPVKFDQTPMRFTFAPSRGNRFDVFLYRMNDGGPLIVALLNYRSVFPFAIGKQVKSDFVKQALLSGCSINTNDLDSLTDLINKNL